MDKNYCTKYLDKIIKVKIDRPKGFVHPQTKIRYPINYGFVPDDFAPDGEEIDCYVLGVDHPISEFVGRCIAVIRRIDDDDDKLIIVPDNLGYSDEEITALTGFQEQFFKITIIRTANITTKKNA